ncbi:unnamed protein product [Periconia digitata]|uniref:Ankyrin repeat protein n=1 Tax=Periconia digitata TaxID=1303443 RepID=A0A9W4U713_9PLEO|nr:unnamed protein product [Periconia digitata]
MESDNEINVNDFDSRLLAAIDDNDIHQFKTILDECNEAYDQSDAGILEHAIDCGSLDIAEELFRRGAKWGWQTMNSLIVSADEYNKWNIPFIDLALEYGWDINEHYEFVGNALVCALSTAGCNIAIISHLLSNGADPNNGSTYNGQSAIEIASGAVDSEKVALLLAHGASVEGTKSLINAAGNGDVATMKLLLKHGADIDGQPYEKNQVPKYINDVSWGSALHCAAKGNHCDAIKLLLEMGATRDIKNMYGLTPVDVASRNGSTDAVRVLEHG